jgi:CubicO group peptidase (beta-lactamase class C family)
MRTLRTATAAVVLAAVLVGCGNGTDAAQNVTTTAAPAGQSTTAVPGGSGSASSTTTASGQSAHDADGGFPGDTWTTVEPAAVGLDAAKLEALAAAAAAKDSTCLAVIRHGKLAGEWYFNGGAADSPQEIYSATKSLTSVLVGIAADDSKLTIDDAASRFIPEWVNTPAAEVKVRHLLSNDSGRHWDFNGDFVGLTSAPDRDAYAIGLNQDSPPGTVWAYNNSAIQTLDRVLSTATGERTADFAAARVFGPLRMTHTKMTTDPAGNTATYFGAQSTCRDQARFGLLALHRGKWDGKRIVSEAFMKSATTPSQDLNVGYGFLWWLNTGSGSPGTPPGKLLPSLGSDAFFARGMFGQTVLVDPGSDTVVVRLGRRVPNLMGNFNEKDLQRVVGEALVDPTR